MYTSENIEDIKNKLSELDETIQNKKLDIFEPTRTEIMEVNKIVLDYIRDNKRKIYGGYALNATIKHKNKDDAFYEDDKIPDIDFYSPDPIIDAIKICNILHDKGYKFVEGRTAFHKETYTVFVNYENAADISYVPKHIYNNIPYVTIDGIQYVHTSFISIDIFREFTEPYFSSDRWTKTFPRLVLAQKHYPLNKAISKLPKIDKIPTNDKNNVDLLLDTTLKFLLNKKSVIVCGRYAYNVFLHESNIMKDKVLGKKYRYVDVPFYRLVSTNYRDDTKELLDKLRSDNKSLANHITIVEHYPFWHFWGYSTYVYYKDTVIAHVIHYARRCTPYKTIDALTFHNKVGKLKGNKIQIGSFDFCFLTNLITTFNFKTKRDNDRYQYYNIATSHLVEIRNYYLRTYNKSILDNTLFQEFVIDCIGDTMNPMRQERLERMNRWLNHKPVIPFKYIPETYYNKEATTAYRFPNSSGNPINRGVNLKIIGEDIPRKEVIKELKEDIKGESTEELELKDLKKSVERIKTINY